LLTFASYAEGPSTLHFEITFKNVLLGRGRLFIWKILYEVIEEFFSNFKELHFYLIVELPFIAAEKTRFIFKLHFSVELIFTIIIVPFTLEVKLAISDGQPGKLGRRSLKTDLLTIIKNNMVPTNVYSIS